MMMMMSMIMSGSLQVSYACNALTEWWRIQTQVSMRQGISGGWISFLTLSITAGITWLSWPLIKADVTRSCSGRPTSDSAFDLSRLTDSKVTWHVGMPYRKSAEAICRSWLPSSTIAGLLFESLYPITYAELLPYALTIALCARLNWQLVSDKLPTHCSSVARLLQNVLGYSLQHFCWWFISY